MTTREQRAVAVIRAGRLTMLQREALAALLVTAGGDEPVGAENSVTSCDLHVLVQKAAESVSS